MKQILLTIGITLLLIGCTQSMNSDGMNHYNFDINPNAPTGGNG
jgi:hypothetical protein